MDKIKYFLPLFFALSVLAEVQQHRKGWDEPRKPSKDRVYLIHSDVLYYDESIHRTAQFLVGNVKFLHDGVYMYCDSALFYESTNSFDAFGHVRMVQGDTLSLTGDVLYYSGVDQLARCRYNVVLTHVTGPGTSTVLYTDSLDYDRLYNLGYFFEGGRLVDGDNQLTSDWGEYSPETKLSVFNYNVRLVTPLPPAEPRTTILSDTMHYDSRRKVTHLLGPSNVESGSTHIYTENGWYYTETEDFTALDRSILTDAGKKLVGDSVCWNKVDSVGEAFGNAVYTDDVNKNMMTGHYCFYDDKSGYAMATDSARLIEFSQGPDSLFAHADTFKVFAYNYGTDSVYRDIHAYRHVRAYRTDYQAVCDSMVYTGLDSCLTMYKDPIVWQNTQQILGEEIKAFFNDSTIDSLYVLRQTLTVERIDSVKYNQINGHEMHSYFRGGDIWLTHVIRNVHLNYYPFDSDSLLIGMNHTESTELKMYFDEERKVDHIWMPAATGTLYPLILIPADKLYLDNFAWFDYTRPRNKDDIWEWRPKKEGTSLKPTVRREAPLQRLDDRRRKKKPKDEAPRDTLASSLAPQDSITYKLQDDGHVSDSPTP